MLISLIFTSKLSVCVRMRQSLQRIATRLSLVTLFDIRIKRRGKREKIKVMTNVAVDAGIKEDSI